MDGSDELDIRGDERSEALAHLDRVAARLDAAELSTRLRRLVGAITAEQWEVGA